MGRVCSNGKTMWWRRRRFYGPRQRSKTQCTLATGRRTEPNVASADDGHAGPSPSARDHRTEPAQPAILRLLALDQLLQHAIVVHRADVDREDHRIDQGSCRVMISCCASIPAESALECEEPRGEYNLDGFCRFKAFVGVFTLKADPVRTT